MSNTGRKHYRVAQKQAQANPINGGLFIPKSKKQNVAVAVVLMLLFVLFDGILIGLLAGRDRD